MGRSAVAGLVGALLLALAVPEGAPAELAFFSERCDQGGVTRPPAPMLPQDGSCRYGIFRMADDATGVERLTNGLNPGEAEDPETASGDVEPAWSPTGAEIVFQRQQQHGDSYARLFVMAANGTAQRRLISDPAGVRDERSPAWSPLGTHIAFAGSQEIPGKDIPFVGILTVRADGSDVRRVSLPGTGADYPVFRPDGRLVFYERSTPGPKFPGVHTQPDRGLVATNILGGDVAPLTFGEATPPLYGEIAFSPDGRYVAVHTSLESNQDSRIWVMRLDTGDLWPASTGSANNPTFSLLGPALFYNEDTGAKRVALSRGAQPTTVAPGRHYGLDWSLLGGVLPAIPKDVLPPAVSLEDVPEAPSRLPFFAVDYSGIDRVDAAVGMRVKGGCRFLLPSRALSVRRSCSKPGYVRVKSVSNWSRRTAKLPDGKYQVRFRATDVRGNRTPSPRAETVRLK